MSLLQKIDVDKKVENYKSKKLLNYLSIKMD